MDQQKINFSHEGTKARRKTSCKSIINSENNFKYKSLLFINPGSRIVNIYESVSGGDGIGTLKN